MSKDIEIEFNDDLVMVATEDGVAIKKQRITVSDIEKMLRCLPYSGQKRVKDPAVENAKLPSLINSFYKYIAKNDLLPDERLFVENYLRDYFFRVKKSSLYALKKPYQALNENIYFTREGLEGRILRAYPSLIRDFHFFLLCKESGKFDKVIYSTKSDIEEGIDLKIIKGGNFYAVSLYVNTDRARRYKKIKYRRHDYTNLREICVTLDWKSAKKIGEFYLYDQSAVNRVLREISKYAEREKHRTDHFYF